MWSTMNLHQHLLHIINFWDKKIWFSNKFKQDTDKIVIIKENKLIQKKQKSKHFPYNN
jgi:hypothetical protein